MAVLIPATTLLALKLNYFKLFLNYLPQDAEITCVSYDVESLFTNIQLDDTIDKRVSKIFKNDDTYKLMMLLFLRRKL